MSRRVHSARICSRGELDSFNFLHSSMFGRRSRKLSSFCSDPHSPLAQSPPAKSTWGLPALSEDLILLQDDSPMVVNITLPTVKCLFFHTSLVMFAASSLVLLD
ncbi:Uncharacterized protein Fot_04208 [Forsythia ovata]|uniref:Uncharacterized protein n=1 Tax=Forsythia ovata TaxID=205694 RepID=A0ABD1XBW8_9LAMI